MLAAQYFPGTIIVTVCSENKSCFADDQSPTNRVNVVLASGRFQDKGFFYVQTPLITASDCEGAGELFRVSTIPSDISKIPKTDKVLQHALCSRCVGMIHGK